MIRDAVFLVAVAAALLGLVALTAEFAGDVKRAEHRLAVFFMAATGGHADPRETGPLNVLPESGPRTSLLAPDWTPAPYAGHHAAAQPRETPPAVVRVDARIFGDEGASVLAWGPGIDVYQRFVRLCDDNGIEHPEFGPLRPTPPEGIQVTVGGVTMLCGGTDQFAPCDTPANPSPSMLPLTGEFPRIHASDRPQYGQVPVLEAERLERLMRP
jgi:hypothetical protein